MLKMPKQKTEEQFGTAFIQSPALVQLLNGDDGYYIRELETMHGRPDLLLFATQPLSDEAMWRAINDSPSTNSFASTFLALKECRGSMSEEQISARTGLSPIYAHQVIRTLLKQDLAHVLKNGKYKLGPKAVIPHTTIISVEFKLHDWKKALKQSIRHRAFADRAYVIMPLAKRKLLLENSGIFSSFGVSVGVFDETTGYLDVLNDVKEDKLSEVSYLDVVSRFWINKDSVSSVATF